MKTLLYHLVSPLLHSNIRYYFSEHMRSASERQKLAQAKMARLKRAGVPRASTSLGKEVCKKLERDGFAVVPEVVSVESLDVLAQQLDASLECGESLNRVSNDRARRKGDENASQVFLSSEEQRQGQEYLRQVTNYASINQPFMNCPASLPLAFLPICSDIASSYLGAQPAVGGANLRKSFCNDVPEFDTLLFHVDPNSPRFLKFFFYLHDVGPGGGPFCYVRGSHRKRFTGWTRKYRWNRTELMNYYSALDFVDVHARKGDLIVADTTGFHAGTKATSADRSMLTVDYLLHMDFYSGAELKIPATYAEQIPPNDKWLLDFLAVA